MLFRSKEFKKGFKKGWFVSRIHDALQELAFDTYYLKVQHDFELPQNLQLNMPEDVFNIREIYIYEGELCNPINTQVVYHKRLFNNNYEGERDKYLLFFFVVFISSFQVVNEDDINMMKRKKKEEEIDD